MELNKNYPWLDNLKILDQDIQKWQSKNSEKSLTFWALENKSIDQKAYFEWAIDNYQMPFLEGIFFEQNLMTKTQWNEFKDLFDWTEEILPVAFWNHTIFVGCVEPPKKEIEVLGFNIRFVLTSYQSLQVMWKFVQSLSHFIEKEVTRSIALNELSLNQTVSPNIPLKKSLDKPVSIEPALSQNSMSPDIPLKKPLDKPVSIEPALSQNSMSPDIPLKKPLDKPVSIEPALSQNSMSPDIPLKKPLDKPVSIEPALSQNSMSPDIPLKKPLGKPFTVATEPSMNLEKQASFPEREEERLTEDNNTFPGRSLVEDASLVMQNVEKDNKQAISKKSNTKLAENTKFTLGDTVDKTLTNFSVSCNYEELWKYTKSFYCTSLVLKVKREKVYPISWTGQIKCQKTEDIFVDLKDYSLFKIVNKGYSYNGFVVDNPVNKKFFSQIGWQEYPKHVTAIPIKNNKNELVSVFVGLGVEPISRGKIQQIEENVLKFFQVQNGDKILKAA